MISCLDMWATVPRIQMCILFKFYSEKRVQNQLDSLFWGSQKVRNIHNAGKESVTY